MTFAQDDLIAALRLRYDHYSAQSVFELARERAGLAEKPSYEPAELRAWRDALAAVGDRVGRVLELVDGMLADAPAKSAKVEAKADVKAEPKADVKAEPKADVKAEPKPEPRVEAKAKPETKPEAKPEPKVEAKPAAKPSANVTALIEATIVLTGVEARDGDQVLVCGEPAALGDWDPERARPMVRAGDEWHTVITVDPQAPLAFKFLRRSADGQITWETGDNRTAAAAPRVEAVWR